MTATMTANPSPRFWDKIAAKYERSPVADEAAYQHKLEVTRHYLRPEMEVLEFGCGTGSTALVHAPHVNHILGLDISDKMLGYARDKAADAGAGNVTFRQGAIETFDAPSSSYDVVMGMSILHLLMDRQGAMVRVRDLLKPGGLFISSTVCMNDGMWVFWPILKIAAPLGLLPHVSFFRGETLLREIADAGFEIEHRWRPGPKKAMFVVARKPG